MDQHAQYSKNALALWTYTQSRTKQHAPYGNWEKRINCR